MLTGMSMKVNGLMIRLTEKANICILMERHTKVNGRTTNSMDKGKRNGQMGQCMRVNMLKGRR